MFSLNRFILLLILSIIAIFSFYRYTKSFQFENNYEVISDTVSFVYNRDTVHSGNLSNVINGKFRYSNGIELNASEINYRKVKSIRYEFYAFTNTYKNEFYFVTHFMQDTIFMYDRKATYGQNHVINLWQKYSGQFDVIQKQDWRENSKILFYVYNSRDNTVYLDDLKVELIVE